VKIKEAVQKRCDKCDSYLGTISPEEYGCDCCGKVFVKEENSPEPYYPPLDVVVWLDKSDSDKQIEFEFCSWKCLFKKLKTITITGWVTLPQLIADNDAPEGRRMVDFLNEIKGEP
jgi:hypothetical protein